MFQFLKKAARSAFAPTCYFCRYKEAEYQGHYYEPHLDGNSRWVDVQLCEHCYESSRHCHYCTLYHSAYNCQEMDERWQQAQLLEKEQGGRTDGH